MAQGNQPQPQKKRLAAEAFRKNYGALCKALVQPDMASSLAVELYSETIITAESRDAVQVPFNTPTRQAILLLQAMEPFIKIDHTKFRKVTRLLKKQPVLEPIAEQLYQCYRKFLNAL